MSSVCYVYCLLCIGFVVSKLCLYRVCLSKVAYGTVLCLCISKRVCVYIVKCVFVVGFIINENP